MEEEIQSLVDSVSSSKAPTMRHIIRESSKNRNPLSERICSKVPNYEERLAFTLDQTKVQLHIKWTSSFPPCSGKGLEFDEVIIASVMIKTIIPVIDKKYVLLRAGE